MSGEWACTPCQQPTFCWWVGLEEEITKIGRRRRKREEGEETEIDREMKKSLRWDGAGERGRGEGGGGGENLIGFDFY